MNWFFALTDPTGWAAIQAVGSIAAIIAGFGTAYWQNRKALQLREQDLALRERDRADRAEVVAFRLSGWLSEVGLRVLLTLDRYDSVRLHNPTMPQPHEIVAQWKLGVAVGIESVMSDLHYLEKGAGDVAQLDFHVRYFDAYLDTVRAKSLHKASLNDPPYRAGEMGEIYKNIRDQLTHMRELHADAERHLTPIVSAAAAKER